MLDYPSVSADPSADRQAPSQLPLAKGAFNKNKNNLTSIRYKEDYFLPFYVGNHPREDLFCRVG